MTWKPDNHQRSTLVFVQVNPRGFSTSKYQSDSGCICFYLEAYRCHLTESGPVISYLHLAMFGCARWMFRAPWMASSSISRPAQLSFMSKRKSAERYRCPFTTSFLVASSTVKPWTASLVAWGRCDLSRNGLLHELAPKGYVN